MDLGLDGKVIVISGGASGIGTAISQACLAERARVAVLSRVTPDVTAFMAEMTDTGRDCRLFTHELGDPAQCRLAIDEVLATYGRIDALVNNAGINDSVGLEHGDPERFLASLGRNLLHYYALAHYALGALKASRGSIVNICSKVALTGQGNTSGYAASKGAQLALTREWAAELLPFGIRVNAVLPAEVMTPLYRHWLDSFPQPEEKLRQIEARIPLGHRMTEPAEIAAAVVFLLSPLQSAHTTAQHVMVDGGYVHLDRALT